MKCFLGLHSWDSFATTYKKKTLIESRCKYCGISTWEHDLSKGGWIIEPDRYTIKKKFYKSRITMETRALIRY